jgi:hypothetical protein
MLKRVPNGGMHLQNFFLDLKNAERICGIKKEIKKYKIKRRQITHLSSQYTINIGAL